MTFFDTNVLISAFWTEHPLHQSCWEVTRDVTPETAACSVHSLAEVYAVTTRLPVRPAIRPEDVFLFLQQVQTRFSIVTLDLEDYASVLTAMTHAGITGGKIYDALLMQCARKMEAQLVYTLNPKDFRRVAPDLGDRIVQP